MLLYKVIIHDRIIVNNIVITVAYHSCSAIRYFITSTKIVN